MSLIKFNKFIIKGVIFLNNGKTNEYTVTFNYKNTDIQFKDIVKNHIDNLIKIPVEYWYLENYDLKYK